MNRACPEPVPTQDAATDTPNEPDGADPRSAAQARRWLAGAFLIALLWYGVLIGLAVTTGNPDIVNRLQIADSVLVVGGDVAASGDVQPDQVFRGVLPDEPLRIILPPEIPPGRYLLPLTRIAGRFEITPARSDVRLRRVYPLTDDVRQQLEELLNE